MPPRRRLRTTQTSHDTDVTLLLDRSGSMESIRADTIGGVNSFIDNQAKIEGVCRLTLIQFDTQNSHEIVQEGAPIKEAKKLDANTFVPRGGTPLYDAMGLAIESTEKRLASLTGQPEHVIMVIMTDGQENQSYRFTRDQVFAKVTEKTAAGWQFAYLGANQDGMEVGMSLGVAAHNTASYAATGQHVNSTYAAIASNVGAMRRGATRSMAFDNTQRVSMTSIPSPTVPAPPIPTSRTRTPRRRG